MPEAAKAREILDGVVQVYLPLPMRPSIVNVYLVRAGDRWTLIDTGMNTEDSVAAFRGALDEIGIDPHAIGRLVATHHHVDHFGTSGPYRELAHAEVYTHPLEAQAAVAIGQIPAENTAYLARHGVPVVPPDRRLPPPSRFFGTWYAPAEPDHLIADEDELPLGDGRSLQVVWTPGHTPRTRWRSTPSPSPPTTASRCSWRRSRRSPTWSCCGARAARFATSRTASSATRDADRRCAPRRSVGRVPAC